MGENVVCGVREGREGGGTTRGAGEIMVQWEERVGGGRC